MTDPCWFPQVIRGELAFKIFCLVWNGYGTGVEGVVERPPNARLILKCCILWFGMDKFGAESEDLIKLWTVVWIGMCARPCAGPFILPGSHMV